MENLIFYAKQNLSYWADCKEIPLSHLDLKNYVYIYLWNVSKIKISLLNTVLPKGVIQVSSEALVTRSPNIDVQNLFKNKKIRFGFNIWLY